MYQQANKCGLTQGEIVALVGHAKQTVRIKKINGLQHLQTIGPKKDKFSEKINPSSPSLFPLPPPSSIFLLPPFPPLLVACFMYSVKQRADQKN
jgi:hypothetical protein